MQKSRVFGKSAIESDRFAVSYTFIYKATGGNRWLNWRVTGEKVTCSHLLFTCVSFGALFLDPPNVRRINSYLYTHTYTLKAICGRHSSISLYVRIIAQKGCRYVALWETEEDFGKALDSATE